MPRVREVVGICRFKFKGADPHQFTAVDFVFDHEVPPQTNPHALNNSLISQRDLVEGQALWIGGMLQAEMFKPVAPVNAVPA